jgi:putative addiction module component (TIGR02574 family)
MSTATDLLNLALTLPRKERASLARELIASLDEPFDDPAEVEAAWKAEIERRVAEIEDGTAVTVSWPEAREQILARLRKR